MSNILNLKDISLNYGETIILDNANLNINQKEIISLLGRNGAGKSTLLKLIAKKIQFDSGVYKLTNQQTIAYLTQTIPDDITGDIFSIVASGLDEVSTVIIDYHDITKQVANNANDKNLTKLSKIQHKMDVIDGWSFQQQIATMLSKMHLSPDDDFKYLSGGVKRQVLLAKALIKNPDLLLLDEPTNHLDITHILWLENLIKTLNCAVLIITHDRQFMQNVSNKILELDRGQLTMWDNDYKNYLRRKMERANAELKENLKFDKNLSKEEDWIRKGIKARRTRNEGRVRKLKIMREQLKQRRNSQSKVNLKLQQFDNSGKLVIEAKNISHKWQDTMLIDEFNLTVVRGDKIGIIGSNGSGKSTLLNILLKKITPTFGSVKLGSNLKIAYFDQLKSTLNLEKNLQDNINDGSDNVNVDGKTIHINSYLQNFLFSPKQIRQTAKFLSGGEKNRLMLAKLFSQPANLLVLDEPTNDLDLETLDLLEELLVNYTGTIILVSHDRSFLDNVVGSSIIFEDNKKIYNSIGGYSDWMNIRNNLLQKDNQADNPKENKPKQATVNNYNNNLSKITNNIEALESDINNLQQQLADPNLYQMHLDKFNKLTKQLANTENDLKKLYDEWQSMEISNNS